MRPLHHKPITPAAASRMSRPIFSAGERGGARRGLALLRQAEAGDHLAQLLAGGDVAEADVADQGEVEQGQALGEELAIDDPLAEPGNDPETDPPRKLVERRADAPHVARLDMLEAVAQQHPVDA